MAESANTSTLKLLPFLPKVPPLDDTFGAVLIGTFVGLMLYGLTLHQSYRYFRMYPGDSPFLKALVVVVVILETFTSVLSLHVCYYYLVTNYLRPWNLLRGTWSINLFPLVSGFVMIASQSFFARRVYVLGSGYRIVVYIAILLCVFELGFFAAATVEAFIIPTFAGFKHVTWLVSTGSTMAVTADILLTATLIYLLRRNRTGIKRTDSMLEVMIMYSINTGLITGVFNFMSLLFAFMRPGDLIYIGIGIPGVKLYANTLMAALNSRKSLKAKCSGPLLDTSPFGFIIAPDTDRGLSADRHGLASPRQLHTSQNFTDLPAALDSVELDTRTAKEAVRDHSLDVYIDRHLGWHGQK